MVGLRKRIRIVFRDTCRSAMHFLGRRGKNDAADYVSSEPATPYVCVSPATETMPVRKGEKTTPEDWAVGRAWALAVAKNIFSADDVVPWRTARPAIEALMHRVETVMAEDAHPAALSLVSAMVGVKMLYPYNHATLTGCTWWVAEACLCGRSDVRSWEWRLLEALDFDMYRAMCVTAPP